MTCIANQLTSSYITKTLNRNQVSSDPYVPFSLRQPVLLANFTQ